MLHYPQTSTTFAWGGAIGVAALLALGLSLAVASATSQIAVRLVLAFTMAFAGYEALLYATSLGLGGSGAFAAPIVARILTINAIAFLGLLALHRAAIGLGLLAPRAPSRLAAA